MAGMLGRPLPTALHLQVLGTVLLAEDQPEPALSALRHALAGWHELDAVYDAARARVHIATACRAVGDDDGAEMELAGAIPVFDRLNAVRDAAAARAGLHLIELGIPENGGLKWRMDPEFQRLMPNFSHGTSGVAYFLATLHQETGRKEFLDAAHAGVRYLQSIAATTGDTCLIFHDEPDNKSLYYLGWCHGPVGTSRLWVRLDQIEPKAGWLA